VQQEITLKLKKMIQNNVFILATVFPAYKLYKLSQTKLQT
jgi:hypothetical protein